MKKSHLESSSDQAGHSTAKSFGVTGEGIAADHLKRKGFRIIDRNYRCRRFGEIDLIALDGKTLVFVEIKCRKNKKYGEPFEAVDERKRRKLRLIAESYLQRNWKYRTLSARFDVVSIILSESGDTEITHIENAF